MSTLGCPLDLLLHDHSWGDIKNSPVTLDRCRHWQTKERDLPKCSLVSQ